jgi:hypothetical protein
MIEHNTPNRTTGRSFKDYVAANNRIEARCDTSSIRRAIEEIEAKNREKRIAKQALTLK